MPESDPYAERMARRILDWRLRLARWLYDWAIKDPALQTQADIAVTSMGSDFAEVIFARTAHRMLEKDLA